MLDMAVIPPRELIQSGGLPWAVRRCFKALLELRFGTFDISLPDGRLTRFSGSEPGPHARIAIVDYAFARRLVSGDVGFAEGYLAEEWTSDNLVSLLSLLAANQHLIERFAAKPVARAFQMIRHWLKRNSRQGSRKNIHAHYDLGNSFYEAWLDGSMTYSSGLAVDTDLAAAQARKYAEIAAIARIEPHHHLLEIGCGWGGFAEYAAREIGCKVTALTISREQYEYAVARIGKAGLSDRVSIKFCDYRDETGSYDRIISIEMFEAVGEAYWEGFFNVLKARLRAGGLAALQIITIQDELFARYRKEMDFIRHYVFPGGMLPTLSHLKRLGEKSGLQFGSHRAFGHDYARTCHLWRERFEAAWPTINPLGFDERFRRIWRYYLAYCEAGFTVGTTDVCHIAFENRGDAC